MSDEAEKKEKIRQLAHQIWVEEGKPEGRAAEHWRRAEAMIETRETEPSRSLPPAEPSEAAASAPASTQRKATSGRKKMARPSATPAGRKDRASPRRTEE